MRSARNRSIDRPLDVPAATQVFCPTIALPVFVVKSDQAVLPHGTPPYPAVAQAPTRQPAGARVLRGYGGRTSSAFAVTSAHKSSYGLRPVSVRRPCFDASAWQGRHSSARALRGIALSYRAFQSSD
jgi:hypothetical protein